MDNSNDPLDKLISETLKSIHSHALQDGLANSHRTLDNVGAEKAGSTRYIKRERFRTSSFVAVAASFLLIVGIVLPALVLSGDSPSSDKSKQIQTANKVSTTSTTSIYDDENIVTTTNPAVFDPGEITTTTKNLLTQNTKPFYSPPTSTTTAPAVVDQYVRISYSNTRANDIPLDGATISGNVYIFIPDLDAVGAIWWLDQPGVWDKNLKTRAGQKKPIDFNYRVQPEAVVPNPYDTSTLSVGEHTMGIESQSISTGKYTRRTIKFYVAR